MLAMEYVQTKSPDKFRDLFFEVYSFLHFMAMRASRRAARTSLTIPTEDFESYFGLALYQATLGYESQKGDFIPRYMSFIRLREADVWRSYRTKNSKEIEFDGVRYHKAQWDSLDRKVSEDEDGPLLRDVVLPSSPSAEEAYLELVELRNLREDLRRMNTQHAKIICLIEYGASKKELAQAFGESGYNARVRKMVQRARSSFQRFLTERNMTRQ